MKRNEIQGGFVYALHPTRPGYGAPDPIVFLQDKASGVYRRSFQGDHKPSVIPSGLGGTAKRGWSGVTGYPAVTTSKAVIDGLPYEKRVESLTQLDLKTELQRFADGLGPSAPGLHFEIMTQALLGRVHGLYAPEAEKYRSATQAARERDALKQAARLGEMQHTNEVLGRLEVAVARAGHDGILKGTFRNGTSSLLMPVAAAEALAGLLEETFRDGEEVQA